VGAEMKLINRASFAALMCFLSMEPMNRLVWVVLAFAAGMAFWLTMEES
jgi:hypothetical protein